MFSPKDIVHYLLERNLLRRQAIVTGGLKVVDTTRRNRNFQVISTTGPCYFVKQGLGAEKANTVAHEADIYRYLTETGARTALSSYLPACIDYDHQNSVLVLELIPEATTLKEYQITRRSFPAYFGRVLGTALGTLHRLTATPNNGTEREASRLPPPPWVLGSLHRPHLRILRDISAANVQLIKILQQTSEFCDLLDELSSEWRSEALMHGDLKTDNCLVFASSCSKRYTKLKIVDWEFAGLGDPLWDVGTVISEYLSLWVNSIPMAGDQPASTNLSHALFPLDHMQPSLAAFWRAWTKEVEPALDNEQNALLLRGVRYAGARLVQSAYEQMQDTVHVTSNVVCLLQVGLNVLKWPKKTATELLGLPVIEVAPQ